MGNFRNPSISTTPKICLSKSSFSVKQYKTTHENVLLETSVVIPVLRPKFFSSPVLFTRQFAITMLVLMVQDSKACVQRHSYIIMFVSTKPLCPLYLALWIWIWILYQLLVGTAITSTLIFPCIITRFHVKHLETLITACPRNLHSNLPLWQSCH